MTRYVLITRHPAECTELQGLLKPCGIKVRPYPVLRLAEVDDEKAWEEAREVASNPAIRKWVAVASPRAPDRFVAGCRRNRCDELLDSPVAVVGATTADAAERAGLRVELVGPGSAVGLANRLLERIDTPTSFILACGRNHRPELPAALTEAGHHVLPIVVYRMDPTPPRELPPMGPSLEAVILTSPRAAELYLAGVGGLPLPCQHWALGATTQNAAGAIGIDCLIPREPSFESLAEELCKT